jgi:phospholipid/cholesterol/gamma-HCH transport system substrate-binding protein
VRDNRTNYVVVGSFVLLALVGLVAAIAVLAGRTGATDTYYTRFDQVSGIAFGTQVLYQGYPVGQVEAVEPVAEPGQRRFRIAVSIKRGWPIDRAARVKISQAGFLSAFVLDIQGGGASELLAPGSEIPATEAPDVLAVLQDVAGQMATLLDTSVKPVLESVGDELPAILTSARTFTTQLEATGARVNALLDDQNVGRLRNVVQNAEQISSDLAALTGQLSETRRQLDATMTALQSMVEDNADNVGKASADLQYTLETVARSIDGFTYNLETMSRNMTEFSRQVRGNPGVLLRGTEPPDEEPRP